MIHSIDAQGNVSWECQHAGCGTQHQHHISHEAIQWCGQLGTKAERQTVRLPPCEGCGSHTFLKVHFTEEELNAPNMFVPWTSERAQILVDLQAATVHEPEGTARKALLTSQIKELEAIRDAGGLHTESHATALRHQELARQLKASGKVPEQGGGQE